MKIKTALFLFMGMMLTMFVGCRKADIPRPYGYFRIDLPPNQYKQYAPMGFPYSFDMNDASTITERPAQNDKYWIDITYPTLKATIYISYKPVNNQLLELTEDTRKIVYKHSVRADAISEYPFTNRDKRVFGILYELNGNVASPIQFVLTDSVKHFFRGALYFESTPNSDSIAPVTQYVMKDVARLMESFEWEAKGDSKKKHLN